MVEVKMLYNYVKEGKSYRATFQTTEMDDAIELLPEDWEELPKEVLDKE